MKSPKSLSDIINSDTFNNNSTASHLTAYQQQTAKFRQINQLLSNILGDNIAQNILVSNYKNSILYLETTSAAIAAGFRMKQSEVLSRLRQEFDVSAASINIKVSPKSTRSLNAQSLAKKLPDTNQTLTNKKTLPNDVAELFEKLAEKSDDALKKKLLQLAQHKRG